MLNSKKGQNKVRKQYILNTPKIVGIKQFLWLVTVSRKQKSVQGQQ